MGIRIKCLPEGPACLNIGCGTRFFPEWTNVDLAPARGVQAWDIRKSLPCDSGVFDATYSSHLLEHLTPASGRAFLAEQFRLLKPSGICRIVVPDLETICREYLHHLETAAVEPTRESLLRYHWMLLELLDQMTREQSGGLMRQALERGEFDEAFVRQRMGDQFARYYRTPSGQLPAAKRPPSLGHSLGRRVKQTLRTLGGQSSDPRQSGEAHKWMYDRLSLRLLFADVGFENFTVCSFDESTIPHWNRYNLDKSLAGDHPRKPDSLYVEARKPMRGTAQQ